jgi:hypothetical protein
MPAFISSRDTVIARRPDFIFAFVAGLLGFAIAAFAPSLFHDGDSWWHIAAGGWMLDHRAVLTHDVFSFTFAGRPWDAQEWLSEVLMALSFRAAGWSGLHFLFGMAAGAAAALVTGGVRARTGAMAAALISLLGLACIAGSLLARPHLLVLPLLALWTLELLKARAQNRAPRWWMALVMLAWANCHGSFAFGLALGCAFALEAALERRAAMKEWGLFLIAMVIAAALTPQGLHGLSFPFQLLLLGSIRNVGEWGSTNLLQPSPFLIAVAGLVYLSMTGKLKMPLIRLLIVAGLVYLALAHVRHQMLFGIVAPLIIAASLQPAPADEPMPRWLMPVGTAALIVMILVRLLVPTERRDDRVTPMTALAHVPSALRALPVLNAYDFGGYLIFAGVKVFVDGRTDMYGDAFLANYDRIMKPDAGALNDALAHWHIAWTILPPGPAARAMDGLPGWRRLYSDGFAVVHSRVTSLR